MEQLQPVRWGRMAGQGDWQHQYQALLTTAEDAAAQVADGEVLAMTGASCWPAAFDAALAARLRQTHQRVEINFNFQLQPFALLDPALAGQVSFRSNFFAQERAEQGENLVFCPTHLSQTGPWISARNPRIAVIACSPPDAAGWMSRSVWGAQVHRDVLEGCRQVWVEINPHLPRIASDGASHLRLHVSEVDGLWINDAVPVQSPTAASDETDRLCAGFIADLVPDGACVQFGLGGLANAIGANLAYAGKRDLGVQSEVVGDCVVDLLEKGVVNNSRKATCPGRVAGSFFVGGTRLWSYVQDNPAFCQKEIDWVNDPRCIAQNPHVVSINNALEIDLTGQVNAETVGRRQHSGTGGQLEWVIGSQWSPGGKSILALRSTYRDKAGQLHSKILPTLPAGAVVTTPRTFVQYVVTEYGVADLKYKSVTERAKALIAIAHPDFRGALKKALSL